MPNTQTLRTADALATAQPASAPAISRRLAAVLVADVVGYSRLMGADDLRTLQALQTHRSLFEAAVMEAGGRLVNAAGDSILAEFASVLSAVECAIRMQRQLAEPGARRASFQYRIGVHVGDVLAEGDQVYGDCVNVAARLQALAEPGGLCISRAVHDDVRDKVQHTFVDCGEQEVKNIAHPVWVYALPPAAHPDPSTRIADRWAAALPSRGKPRVAVLPFATPQHDPEHEYFCYGLTEDVIRLLGRARWLDVLTRHSTRAFRGREVSPRDVAAALDVRYIVQGSVQPHGKRVRIAAEVVEAESERQIWGEAFDLDLEDIFDIQDVMAQQIAAAIEPELGTVEQQAAARKSPENLDAWDCFQRGFWHLWGFTRPGFAEAEAMFRQAIAIEPGLARAHAALAYVHFQNVFYSPPAERPSLLQAAFASAKTAVSLDERDCFCHCVLGRVLCLMRHYDEAIAALQHCIALNPSFAQGYFALAFTLVWSGREEEAIALVERAAELSPRDPHLWTFFHVRSMAHFALNELDEAELFARKAVRQPNATYFPYATLVSIYGLTQRADEAEEALQQLLAVQPAFTLSLCREDFFYCANERLLERYLEGLRAGGAPA